MENSHQLKSAYGYNIILGEMHKLAEEFISNESQMSYTIKKMRDVVMYSIAIRALQIVVQDMLSRSESMHDVECLHTPKDEDTKELCTAISIAAAERQSKDLNEMDLRDILLETREVLVQIKRVINHSL